MYRTKTVPHSIALDSTSNGLRTLSSAEVLEVSGGKSVDNWSTTGGEGGAIPKSVDNWSTTPSDGGTIPKSVDNW
jgi:hypothetical protein